jgi:hypothetical protein
MNAKTAFAIILGVFFLLLLIAVLVPDAAVWPISIPAETAAGTVMWKDRTFEVVLQGFIILAGVFSILLLLGSMKSRKGAP